MEHNLMRQQWLQLGALQPADVDAGGYVLVWRLQWCDLAEQAKFA